MPVAPFALTTLDAVREFLQVPVDDTDQDAIIEALIDSASREILNYAEREFAPKGTADVAREFEYAGGGLLPLTPFSLRELTSVEIDIDEASPTVLTADEYRLYPYPNAHGVFTALRLEPYIASSRGRWSQRLVRVTGKWGFDAVPAEVKHWCNVTVATWIRRDVSAFTNVLKIDEGQVERPAALPSAARAALSHWRPLLTV